MSPSTGEKAPSKEVKESSFKTFLTKLKKRHIIETFAGFIAGGWLFLEFVDRILIAHYELNKKWLDVSFITLLGAMLCIILWRWFSGIEKRPGNVKAELLLVPLIVLAALAIDLNFIFQMAGIPGKKLLIGIVALCLGIVWVIFKSLQWAAITPESTKKEVEISSPATWKPEKSIVVLPFSNISPEQGQDYFCDGLTDELITRLSQIKDLKVIAKTSAFSFKGKETDIRDIGKKLNVSTILEGGVRKAGNKLRITAQFINVSDGSHLWSESYDKELTDVFVIQDEIAMAVAEKLKITLLGEEKAKLAKRPTENFEAYRFYLQGRYFWNKRDEKNLTKSIEYFEKAIEQDPKYAIAYTGVRDAYSALGVNGIWRAEKAYPKARSAALKALEIDDKLAEAHVSLAAIMKDYDWNFVGAEKEFKLAIELNPGYATAHHWYAFLLSILGRHEEAIREIKTARNLDPLSPSISANLGQLLYSAHRYDQALEELRKALEVDPNHLVTHIFIGWAYEAMGKYEEAVKCYLRHIELSGQSISGGHALAGCYALMGKREEARNLLNKIIEDAKKNYFPSVGIAWIFSALGEKDQTFAWLEKAFHERDPFLLMYLKTTHWFDPVRSDPRYAALLKKVGLDK